MKQIVSLVFISIFILSCNKDKFTSVPQIRFNSISPNYWTSDNTSFFGPKISFNLRDAEGDLGFEDIGISYVYLSNTADPVSPPDSIAFPNMPITGNSNMEVDVEVDIVSALPPAHIPGNYSDTIYYDIYVKDFAGNKSNVVRSAALYYYTP